MALEHKFCPKPFRFLEIGAYREGRVPCYACCPQLVDIEVGDFSSQKIDEVWNSKEMQDIRASILEGSFKFCKVEDCPEILSNALPDRAAVEEPRLKKIIKEKKTLLDHGPEIINLSYDETCNLACPSCRTDYINLNHDIERTLVIENLQKDLLAQGLTDAKEILFCSSGDPFASNHFKNFLRDLDFKNYPDLKLQIVTNGVLFSEKMWEQFENLRGHIGLVCISIDAAQEETYKITRRGGSWKILMENLKFLSKLRGEGEFESLRLDFVVQDYNYKEMPAFVDLGKKFKVDSVFFQKIVDWGTYSKTDMKQRLIYSPLHPEFEEFKKVCLDKRLSDELVNPGNLGAFIKGRKIKRKFSLINAFKHTIKKRFG